MVYFQTKNPDLDKYFEDLAMEDVGIFYGHLVYSTVIWYISPRFGMLHQEKSGNPARHP
jgi:hypothetical protein